MREAVMVEAPKRLDGPVPDNVVPDLVPGRLYEVELCEFEEIRRLRFVRIAQCADGPGWRFHALGKHYLLGANEFLVLSDCITGKSFI
jgi:hypothetical protein